MCHTSCVLLNYLLFVYGKWRFLPRTPFSLNNNTGKNIIMDFYFCKTSQKPGKSARDLCEFAFELVQINSPSYFLVENIRSLIIRAAGCGN